MKVLKSQLWIEMFENEDFPSKYRVVHLVDDKLTTFCWH